jgi:hypothetical protein
MDISNSSKEDALPLATTDTTMPPSYTSSNHINLLLPPIIVATGNIAMGATTDKLHKQNRSQGQGTHTTTGCVPMDHTPG